MYVKDTYEYVFSGGKSSKSEVALDWEQAVEDTTDLAQMTLPDWEVALKTGAEFTHETLQKIETDGIDTYFELERNFATHMMHTYFPSIMIAISSICAVFVPSDLVPGRMGLCITAFLSMISLFNGAREDWPTTTYMKSIDVWTTGCYVTVFVSLVEYCLVLYFTKKSPWEKKVRHYRRNQLEAGAPDPGGKGAFTKVGAAPPADAEAAAAAGPEGAMAAAVTGYYASKDKQRVSYWIGRQLI